MSNEQHVVKTSDSSYLERLAEKLGLSANAANIYGTPVERDGVTIIPVAKVMYGVGGGSGHRKGEEGSGGGGGVSSTPVGYIEMKNGEARFRPIRDPLIIWPIIAGSSLLTLWALKGIIKLARK
jgi:uncharacterized spore protein YtfJ